MPNCGETGKVPLRKFSFSHMRWADTIERVDMRSGVSVGDADLTVADTNT